MDADKDGKVSKDELTAFRAAQVAGSMPMPMASCRSRKLAAMHLKAMTDAATNMAQNDG